MYTTAKSHDRHIPEGMSYKYLGQYKHIYLILCRVTKKVKKISETPGKKHLIGKYGHETDENSNKIFYLKL